MQPILAVLALGLGLALGPGESQAPASSTGISTTTLTIPTYPYAGFLQVHHSDTYNMDYLWLDWAAYEASEPFPVPQDYTALVAENPWLRLTFLPELGGRLYGVTVKATGEELLYQNPVIKPTHWGPVEQPWWLAVGGVEWCLPVDEHGYEWAVPWGYEAISSTQGVTVTLWDTAASDRVRARIDVYLPADRAAFQITPRLENPTAAPVTFKFWHNAALAPGVANTVGPDLRFVVPIDQVTVHSRGDDYLPPAGEAMAWPLYGSTDYSRLGDWNRWLGFFARPQASRDWAAVYDEAAQRGMARIFPRQVAVGVKGFAFGWQDPIDWHNWTDDGSTYVELHGGPSPTFWDTITLDPGESLEWTETWLPLQELPLVSRVTADLAFGIEAVGADLDVGVLVADQRNDVGLRLWRKVDCAPLWRVDGLDLAPGEAYAHHLPGLGLGADEIVLGIFEGSTLLAVSGDLDCPLPTAQVDSLDPVQTTGQFTVSWSADDPGAVLAGYDLQVRDGDADAAWTDWLTATTTLSATFGGQDDHTYTFRSRARDAFGYLEPWPANQWQDTFTTVLLQPAPVLVTSAKVAQPLRVHPGEILEFQIHLDNTGNLSAGVQITDTLPTYLELTAGPYIVPPSLPAPQFAGHTLTWSGTLAAGQTGVAIGFDARLLELPPGGVVGNVVWIDDGVHPVLRREVQVSGWRRFYLPLVVKE